MVKIHRLKFKIINAITVVTATFFIGSLIFYYSSQLLKSNLEESLLEIAYQAARVVEEEINGYLNVIETISVMDSISDNSIPWEQKMEILKSESKRNGFLRMSIADINGDAIIDDGKTLNISDREYIKNALNGQRYVSDPLISRNDGTLVTTFAVPIYNNGNIIGVLYATTSADELSKITDNVKLGVNGSSFITNQEGKLIAFEDRALLYDVHLNPENVTNNPKIKSIMDLEQRIIYAKKGVSDYSYEGVQRIAAYVPIRGTQWYLTVSAPKNQVLKSANQMIMFVMSIAIFMIFAIVVSILQMQYMKKSLIKEQSKSFTAIDIADLLVICINQEGTILKINSHVQDRIGIACNKIAGFKTIFDIIPQDSIEKAKKMLKTLNIGEKIYNFELPIKAKDNGISYILWNIGNIDEYEESKQMEIFGVDITDRINSEKQILLAHEELTAVYEELSASEEELKQQFDELVYNQDQLRQSEERYSFVIEASDMGIWDYDMVSGEKFYSMKWYEIFNLRPDDSEFKNMTWFDMVYADDVQYVKRVIEYHQYNGTEFYECEHRVKIRDGSIKWIKAIGKVMLDTNGNVIRMAGSHTDITDKKDDENRIHKLAYYDSLTGLPNRTHFEEWASLVIMYKTDKAALLFIDIDNFKYVNDSFGHPYGDNIIVEVGKRIAGIIGNKNKVARLGGDEFIIMLTDIDSTDKVRAYADDLIQSLDMSFSTSSVTMKISVSIGIAVYPEDGSCFEELMKNADTAMYKAKEAGKRSYKFFDKSMNTEIYDRMIMESNIRRAIAEKEFILHYQPQYDLKTGLLCGFESLIRWKDPNYGYIQPLKFIPLAEETELIIPLGKWVLKTACCFIRQLHDMGHDNLIIAVNVSVIQLLQEDFVDSVLKIVSEAGLKPDYLELEITETILMESIESNLDKINILREHGIRIALDDFGTGYSSLTYLRQLPLSTLKIEKAFINNLDKQKQDSEITLAIIQMAHSFGLKVVAEGVEKREQLEYLKRFNCDIIQGFLAGKPLSEKEILDNIRRYNNFQVNELSVVDMV